MIPFNPVELLSELISIQSLSKEEAPARVLMEEVLDSYGVNFKTDLNNIWSQNKYFDDSKFTVLLNSHLDTVKPNKGYTNPPYEPIIEGDNYMV